MREKIIGNSLNLIKTNNSTYSEEKLAEIEYGLVSIYLLISKLIIIILLAYILGILKEVLIFSILYNFIRMPSFGLHATKSWICLLISIIMFLGIPIICLKFTIPVYIKLIMGAIATIFILKNSPADTHKRPIVNKKRRKIFKISSTIISMIFVIVALNIKDNFLSNALILSLICQCLFISPLIYKIFKLPYNNYKKYNLAD